MSSKAAQMLRARRLDLGLSQFEVAKLAGGGVREKNISQWESGAVRSPPLLGMFLVSRALGLDLYDLARALDDDSHE